MTNELLNDLCARCRKGKVSPVAVAGVHSRDGVSVSFEDEFMRCDACGREFYTTEQSMARSRAITAALRKHQGFLAGDEIRGVRLSYGLSLADFEKALGVGKNTVGRWERNTVPPTGAANLGLWMAVNEPEAFVKWAKTRGIDIKQRPRRRAAVASRTLEASQAPTTELAFRVIKGGLHKHAAAKTEAALAPPIAGPDLPVEGVV